MTIRRTHHDSPLDQLIRFEPFASVPVSALAPIRPHVDVVRLPAGTVLALAGHPARQLAIVLEGEVERNDSTTAGAGTTIGQGAMLRHGTHLDTVKAITDVELVVVGSPACRWVAQTALAAA